MKTVQVLMSTYNGEKYINEQLDSIINQKGVIVHLLIRDDGSKDDTLKILKEYATNYKNINIIEGKNVGVCDSFFELINYSGNYDYYSFADQDDVWDQDKLLVAVNAIEKYENFPAVYASNTNLVDENLKFLKKMDRYVPKTTLGSGFVKNYCTGCTMVINNKLIYYLRENKPKSAPIHDWWINLVCLTIGGISYYDIEPHIKYRQHGKNAIGAENNIILKFINRWNKFMKKPYHRNLMASELILKYGNYSSNENYSIINAISNSKKILIFDKRLKTNSIVTNLLFDVCVFFNRI